MEKQVMVEVSARHIHLSQEHLEILFGNDYTLSITEEEHKFDVLLIIPLL